MSTWPASTSAAPTKQGFCAWMNGLFSGSGGSGTTGATSKSSPGRLAVAAAGTRAPLCYGRVQVPGTIGAIKVSGSTLYLLLVWCEGEIDSIQGLVASGSGDTAVTYARTDYRGTASQGVDPWLKSAIGTAYNDTLRGNQGGRSISLAYSVVKVASGQPFPASPRATIKGLKIFDPRTNQTAWSANPALILADLLTRAGETVDWSGSVPAFDLCDEVIGGAPRWTAGLIIDSPSSILDHAERLRGYAHCMLAHGPDGIRLIPDGPVDPANWISLGPSEIVQGSLKLWRRPSRDTPSCVRVTYTDTAPPTGQADGPWGQATVSAQRDSAGISIPWIESGLTLDGIQSHAEAFRAAQQRLYGLVYRDLLAQCQVRDAGLRLLPGDVVSLSHPLIGLDPPKPMRVLDASIAAPGRYHVNLEEYDPAVYSSAAPSAPTYPDTGLRNPLDVPAPTLAEPVIDIFAQIDGTYATRLRLSWTADYPYGRRYELQVILKEQGGIPIWTAFLDGSGQDDDQPATAVTPPLLIGKTYTWRVRLLASIGLAGPWGEAELDVPIPNYRPTDVSKLIGVELGGEVRLSWTSSIDTDIWRYEVRWGPVEGTWDEATLLDRVDSLRLSARDIPEGTWMFWVKALDSIGQYSENPATVTLAVTRDTRAFFVGEKLFSTGIGANYHASTDRYGVLRAYTQGDSTVNQLFTNAANTYTLPVIRYGVPNAASELSSDVWDLGVLSEDDRYTGTLSGDLSAITAMPGLAASLEVLTSLDNSTWTERDADDLPIKTEVGYVKLRVTATANNGFLWTSPRPTLRLDVVALEESGIVTTTATDPATVTLSRDYGFTKTIILTPAGTGSRSAVYDNIQIGSPTTFDVYLFDQAGNQISGQVSWRFQGV